MPVARRSSPRDDGSFDAFFRETYPRAVAVARRVTGDLGTAEDAAIEGLAKAYARWRRLEGEAGRGSWVLKVVAREALRRLPRSRPPLADVGAARDPAEDVAVRETLAAALASLPRRQREVLVLRYLVGLSEQEVATTLAVSHGTVKTHLRRGLARLRATVASAVREEPHAEPA